QAFTVRAEDDPPDPSRVSPEHNDLLAGHVPQPDCAVPAGRGQALAVRAEADVHDPVRVAAENGDFLAAFFPQPHRLVLTGGGETLAVWTEADVSDRRQASAVRAEVGVSERPFMPPEDADLLATFVPQPHHRIDGKVDQGQAFAVRAEAHVPD